jgi:WD40 repeat protein
VTLWNADTGQAIRSFPISGDILVFSPDRKHLAFVSSQRDVQVWDISRAERQVTLATPGSDIKLLRFSPDGSQLALAGAEQADQLVKVWDVASGKQLVTLRGHTGPVWDVAFTSDNQRLASASDDGTVKLWDLTLGLESLSLRAPADPSTRLDFSPGGERLFCQRDNEVRIWNAAPLAHAPVHPAISQRPKIGR